MKVSFYIQREIVSGLRYEQKTSRKGIQGENSINQQEQIMQ
jgi:hypothetical protein